MCQWCGVDTVVNNEATEGLYAAPEVNGIFEVTGAADWWSFGAFLFELLTGKVSCFSAQLIVCTLSKKETTSFFFFFFKHTDKETLLTFLANVNFFLFSVS